MNYAIIENGVVTNVIYLHPMNASDFPNAVPLGEIPAGIGDTYSDGAFYRNGELIVSETERLKAENTDMQAALAMLGVSVDE